MYAANGPCMTEGASQDAQFNQRCSQTIDWSWDEDFSRDVSRRHCLGALGSFIQGLHAPFFHTQSHNKQRRGLVWCRLRASRCSATHYLQTATGMLRFSNDHRGIQATFSHPMAFNLRPPMLTGSADGLLPGILMPRMLRPHDVLSIFLKSPTQVLNPNCSLPSLRSAYHRNIMSRSKNTPTSVACKRPFVSKLLTPG
ncbi:hypothetical protein P154DRAFT_230402 [Amniculicola lignicola CBS 123094]|uniref:Uncharacterized protein n=1 Tax=Amniculicola lignicola CBS 123094 TaxID=1392246 RepID=A0A6A5WBY9_9PLEO|nr:hypothetical protein P154DRAFT_230402 [Amniculicola lignicola CBS 123094]